MLAILVGIVALSDWLGRRAYLRQLGGALIVIILGAILSNARIVPMPDQLPALYGPIFTAVTPAALFLVLLEANLRSFRRAGAPMLIAFALGAAGTIAGVLAAAAALPGARTAIGDHFPAIGGMLAGTYIGGSANLNAVALAYGVGADGLLYVTTVVVDNVMTTFWILLTIALPALLARSRLFPRKVREEAEAGTAGDEAKPAVGGLAAVAVPLALAIAGTVLSNAVAAATGGRVPAILILTTLALAAAQIPAVARLTLARPMGMAGIYLFLAVIGISADISALAAAGAIGALLFGFVAIIFAVHLAVLLGGAALLRLDPDIVAIASNANIGGASTAIALAEVRKRDDLVIAGLVAGMAGTATGTYAGFLVASLL